MAADPSRAARLKKSFDDFCRGGTLVTPRNYQIFLESICAEPDTATCINKLISSNSGLSSLTAAMRVDLSPVFCNGAAADIIAYVSSPELSAIGSGDFLRLVLQAIVEPPIFWTAFSRAFKAGQLKEKGQLAFASLLYLLLASLPEESVVPFRECAEDKAVLDALLASPQQPVRTLGEKIKRIVDAHTTGTSIDIGYGPGGRHDNDKVDFRDIAILPTADEVTSSERPFLRPSSFLEDPETVSTRPADYLDNQFRLLREDMIYEVREELQIEFGKKKSRHRNAPIRNLELLNVHQQREEDPSRDPLPKQPWSIALQCRGDLPPLSKVPLSKRVDWLRDNRWFVKHLTTACLLVEDHLVAFATVVRDEELLARKRSVLLLRLEGEANTARALMKLKWAKSVTLVQVDTAVFAYEPVLRAVQEIKSVPLSDELLFWSTGEVPGTLSRTISLVHSLRADPTQDLRYLLKTTKSIVLDPSQSASLLLGLTQSVSLIQGPPGTGKSFIGALIAKAIHDSTSETILVVCYTNHALDQFLEDLLDIGIPSSSMVRLGGKSTPRTEPLSLHKLKDAKSYRLTRADWTIINDTKADINIVDSALTRAAQKFMATNLSYPVLMNFLEFEESDIHYALVVPKSTDGMERVTKKGKKLGPFYLVHQWVSGWDAGLFKDAANVRESPDVWQMPKASRKAKLDEWQDAILKEEVARIHNLAKNFNKLIATREDKYDEANRYIISSKRIIGCTTTAAAKYRIGLKAASPSVLLVEEAGEILESHTLTALAPETKQLILIGDHKQLRPKVNSYQLTVEKGEGFDLNRSLFERLVLKGYPHKTLSQQHRMRPEISAIIRRLMYPNLVDAASTQNRPNLRGVRSNVVFINHDHPEDSYRGEQSDANEEEAGRKASKTNPYEVAMVLKILRYLGQQGYTTDKIVILTPYLGQLRALQNALKSDNDPILNDLDSADLVRAGLLSESAAKISKQPIRLATIDNYQGEESDIVIVSLTRSNSDCMIGFMSAPERVNVLLSRARNALIMLGNAHTFMKARKGGETWSTVLEFLKNGGHIFDGLPVKCERHQDRTALLSCADDFDHLSPDGGCTQACGAQLSCGHDCSSKCHQIYDHSKMPCDKIMYDRCLNSHQLRWKCRNGRPNACSTCDKEAKAAEKRQKEEFLLQEKRDREAREHAQKIAEIDTQISRERETLRDAQLAEEREHAILQKKQDLKDAASLAAMSRTPVSLHPTHGMESSSTLPAPHQTQSVDATKTSISRHPQRPTTTNDPDQTPGNGPHGAQADWERQKTTEGVENASIDAIMEMTGLELVKRKVLDIKTSVDTARRQGVSHSKKRYNLALLGNPGTGKTTVARHFARFLSSEQVLSGNDFVETTGARLANEGVNGAKKVIENILKAGGGTLFCDEAYQLAGEHNFQGRQVLDFLLAEMENNIGKIVFIFAGYNKEMEKFFEHNPGLQSRVPHQLQFDDYKDDELLTMLEKSVEKRYKARMKIDDDNGIRGLYGRIAVRRLGRGRGRNGFGNARALENLLDHIEERQAGRLRLQRREGKQPDDLLFVKEDLIGPDPSQVMQLSADYKKLQGMIGLAHIKETVANLFSMVKMNYDRELKEKEPHSISLNRVFIGSPGTGKTTVARIYGRILAELGLISNGEVVVKNPADFIGSALGQSESQTKAILASTVGKVLVIDEAYMLYGGSGSVNEYKTAVIDTIVAEVQSTLGEDRAVLLLGYKDQIEEMFQNVNPGLSRRFAIEDAFVFEDYSDDELLQALDWKLKVQDLSATNKAKAVAIEILSRMRNRRNFGNIGEVENLLSKAKIRYQQRQATLPAEQRSADAPFEPQDFDADFDRSNNASTNLAKLFDDVVGCEDIVAKLGRYQQMAQTAKNRGHDPRDLVPTNFVFKGPPGTGKTTTARKMGQVYYDMGFLSSTEVVECSASDLVGQYVGHTGPKTRKMLEKALSKVLFVDEAYRLSEGHFAKEAMDELVGLLTQETFRGKLLVILAGYDQEMNDLLRVNSGLSSRFPEEIIFCNLTPPQSIEVLRRRLAGRGVRARILSDSTDSDYAHVVSLIEALTDLPSWGNARDIGTLANQLVTIAFTNPESSVAVPGSDLNLASNDVIECIGKMLIDRQARSDPSAHSITTHTFPLPEQRLDVGPLPAPSRPTIARNVARKATPSLSQVSQPEKEDQEFDSPVSQVRDAGVSDAVWQRLLADKLVEDAARQRAEDELKALAEAVEHQRTQEHLIQAEVTALAARKAHDDEAKRLWEAQRLRESRIREERAKQEAALVARRQEEERRRKEEARVQAKLREMGVCVAGFRWIKQSSGYRCAGGSHFIDNVTLGIV